MVLGASKARFESAGSRVQGACRFATRFAIATLNILSFFVEILAGNIVLRHLVGVNFLLVGVVSGFHTTHHVGLKRVSLFE
jgi:hypothetical protein